MKTRFDSNRAIATEDLLQAAGMNPRVHERTLTRMAQDHIDARHALDAAASSLQELANAVSGRAVRPTSHEREARETVGAPSPNVALLRLQLAMQRSHEVFACMSGIMRAFDDMDASLRRSLGLPPGAYRRAELPAELVTAIYSGVTAAFADVNRALASAQSDAMLPVRNIRC